jgi:hypothetical protein
MCEEDTVGDLELYSTEDLIEEIIRRKTFQGVIVHAEGDCKNHAWRGVKDFKVHWNNNLKRHEAGNILERMSHAL